MDSPNQNSKPTGGFTEFQKHARSILWRQDRGYKHEEKKTYNAWMEGIAVLKDGGFSYREAVVEASKSFLCLHRLFREYDVSMYDSNSENFVVHGGISLKDIKSEGKEQSHRDNLNWAITAAGEFLRTGKDPATCPNDAAYYLYMQAKDQPKDFLSRFNQIESKSTESEEDRKSKKATRRSIEELESMLDTLDEEV